MSRKAVEAGPGADIAPGDTELIRYAAEALRIEAESVLALIDRLGPAFPRAARRILEARGRVVVTGVGKSGLVARKIASTLSSTGTPALFLHPVEGAHGDVGVLMRGDVLIVVSRSGASDELTTLLPAVRRLEVPIIALTGEAESPLGRAAETVLDVSVEEEACPHDLAPTSSSTAALAMGDALAMALLRARGLGAEDYARLHPSGALGRRLLWRVEDVMLTGSEVPRARAQDSLAEAMGLIAHRRGTVPVIDAESRVEGVITAGDLTRYAEAHADFLGHAVGDAMNREPRLARPRDPATDALRRMREHGIMAMPVVDEDGRLRGIVHLHDLLRAGVS